MEAPPRLSAASVAGTPAVWMAPNWAEHPVNENFYGKAGASSATDSPYDAVFSPTTKRKGMYGARDVFASDKDLSRPTNNNDEHDIDSLKPRESLGTTGMKAVIERPASHTAHTLRELTQDCHGGANPQGGMTPPSMHLTILRRKLESCLNDVNAKLDLERQHFDASMAASTAMDERMKQSKPHPSSLPELFDMFIGSLTSNATADGLPRLYGMVARAAAHRCMNQLHRHRRYLQSLHHILSGAQVTDVGLTSKEVASVATVDDVLSFDMKLHLLSRQRDWLLQLQLAREQEMAHSSLPTSAHHPQATASSRPQSKHTHMKKLLEAASWYRWLQQRAHEDNNSVDGDDFDQRHDHLAEMLSEDAFLSEHVDLMATDEWRFVVQAQFENLVFANVDRRMSVRVDKGCFDAAALYCEPCDPTAGKRSKAADYLNVDADWSWLRDPQPTHVMAFVARMTRHIRRTFAIPDDVHKSLYVFIQRMLFPRMTMLCFNGAVLTDCARKDALWRSKQAALRQQHQGKSATLEQLGVSARTAEKLRRAWPTSTTSSTMPMFPKARVAFGAMQSIVPCDLLDEMMHGVVMLHQEAAQIFGTTRIPVDTFFPLFSFVLLHTDLPFVHAQLHLLEQFALCNPPGDLNPTRNGEESYYVYCMHAAVEHVCSQVVAPLE